MDIIKSKESLDSFYRYVRGKKSDDTPNCEIKLSVGNFITENTGVEVCDKGSYSELVLMDCEATKKKYIKSCFKSSEVFFSFENDILSFCHEGNAIRMQKVG